MVDIFNTKIQFVDKTNNKKIARTMEQLEILLTTFVGTAPLNRDFGISVDILDLPMNYAKARYMSEVAEKIKKYIQGVEIKKISFKTNLETGLLIPEVVVIYE